MCVCVFIYIYTHTHTHIHDFVCTEFRLAQNSACARYFRSVMRKPENVCISLVQYTVRIMKNCIVILLSFDCVLPAPTSCRCALWHSVIFKLSISFSVQPRTVNLRLGWRRGNESLNSNCPKCSFCKIHPVVLNHIKLTHVMPSATTDFLESQIH